MGLESYGKATGFYARQIGSLSKVAAAQAAAKDTEGNVVGPIPDLEELSAWFKKNEVQDSTSIVHGDYKVSKNQSTRNQQQQQQQDQKRKIAPISRLILVSKLTLFFFFLYVVFMYF